MQAEKDEEEGGGGRREYEKDGNGRMGEVEGTARERREQTGRSELEGVMVCVCVIELRSVGWGACERCWWWVQ